MTPLWSIVLTVDVQPRRVPRLARAVTHGARVLPAVLHAHVGDVHVADDVAVDRHVLADKKPEKNRWNPMILHGLSLVLEGISGAQFGLESRWPLLTAAAVANLPDYKWEGGAGGRWARRQREQSKNLNFHTEENRTRTQVCAFNSVSFLVLLGNAIKCRKSSGGKREKT